MEPTVRVRCLDALVASVAACGTQRDLARKIGRSPTMISNLMRGRRSCVTLETAGRIEEAVGVPRGTLFRVDGLDLVAPYLAQREAAA
jgi:transcriptional regulator with XRE-family HTH domain